MSYSDHLRKLFPGITLTPEDLLVLESFQIKYLPDRLPKKEFAALLRANPVLQRFFTAKYPPIKKFIDTVLDETEPIHDKKTTETYSQEMLWEIAELIVYNKYPEIYDKAVKFNWQLHEIIPAGELKGKIVLDVGSGTGKLAFLLAPYAGNIYAVEPISSLRQFIREKARERNINNLFVVDGFLDSLPFPDESIDILMTSNAIGWNISDELHEIERVVKQGGTAIHLMRTVGNKEKNPYHELLISPEWRYSYSRIENKDGLKMKYSKNRQEDKD